GRLRPQVPGARGQHRPRHRGPLQPAAAGERDGQLREGGPARARQDRVRERTGHGARPAPGNVGGADHPHEVSAEASAPSASPVVNPWLVATAVMFATFMEILDTTVVNVSLPHIAGSLSASID